MQKGRWKIELVVANGTGSQPDFVEECAYDFSFADEGTGFYRPLELIASIQVHHILLSHLFAKGIDHSSQHRQSTLRIDLQIIRPPHLRRKH